jgi:hypothetical protein
MTNTELANVVWPGKIYKSTYAMMQTITMTVGRCRNSFMGVCATGAKLQSPPAVPGEMRWTITGTGIEYLATYDRDPEYIIRCERDTRLWLQDNGRRYMSAESQAKRAALNSSLMDELAQMRGDEDEEEVQGVRNTVEQVQYIQLWAVYEQLVSRAGGGYAYRTTAGGRRRL